MPRRLLAEPHVLAHELRTPLSILAGWYSLVRDGDVTKTGTPQEWEIGMAACQSAIDRLNFIIAQACDEAEALHRPEVAGRHQYETRLFEETVQAIERSRALLARLEERRGTRVRQPSATR